MARKRKKTRTAEALRATAFHEAGHVVVSLALGVHVKSVTIQASEDAYGRCIHPSIYNYEAHTRRERRALARDCILVCYAGLPAQRLVDPSLRPNGCDQDEKDAAEISRRFEVFPRSLKCVGDDTHRAFLDRLRQESARLVKRHKEAIRLLAEELLRRTTMSTNEIEQWARSTSDVYMLSD
jgi:ATP-dependent Zn protease